MKLDLKARKVTMERVRRLVMRKEKLEEKVTLRESAVMWKRSGIVASGFLLESSI